MPNMSRNNYFPAIGDTTTMGFVMRVCCLIFWIVVAASADISTVRGEDANSNVAAMEKLDSSLWVSTSGEYAACARQTFNAATEKLDLALRDKTWTASTEQFDRGNYQELPPAVMVNLDETVWNNTPYEARLILWYAVFNYDQYTDWANEANCPAVPGAKQFLEHVREQNVAIIYLSPRGENMRDGTVRNLKKLELPYDPAKDRILLGEEWANHDKREEVGDKYRILLIVSDYLGDFMHDTATESSKRRKMAERYANNWGLKWFIVPNPMYGHWDYSLYKFQYDLDHASQVYEKLQALDPGKVADPKK
jgi:5'-nucleotidase (lipoprotein e(P4) family)